MRRLILFLAAVPVGLATGLGAWFAANGPAAAVEKVSPLEAEIASLPKAARHAPAPRSLVLADLAASPMFVMTVGPGAVTEPSIRVDGVSVSSRRSAALVSIGGAPADWLSVGETRDGVTLEQIAGGKVTVETVVGEKEVALGDTAKGTEPLSAPLAQATIPPPSPPGPMAPLPRTRAPPPPAGARSH